MRILVVVVTTLLTSLGAYAGGNSKTPISDAELLLLVDAVRAEVIDYSHKDKAERAAYRILRSTSALANNNFCIYGIVADPNDDDMLDLLDLIEQGISSNAHNYKDTKQIAKKLERAQSKLEKRRTIDVSDVAEISINNGEDFDFGQAVVGQLLFETVVVTNSGTQTANGLAFGVVGSGDFSFVGGSCNGLTLMAAGDSCTLDLLFAPVSLGIQTQTITIDYNNSQQNVQATLDVLGEGI